MLAVPSKVVFHVYLSLQAIAPYKNRNPGSIDEEEYLENLFNSLCACLISAETRSLFLKAEGMYSPEIFDLLNVWQALAKTVCSPRGKQTLSELPRFCTGCFLSPQNT